MKEGYKIHVSIKSYTIFFDYIEKRLGLLNCTPKVRQKNSNFWGAFIMKLTYEDKVRIYELKKQGESFRKLSDQFGINISNLQYMIKLIDHYGIEIVKKGKNCYSQLNPK